MLTSKKDLQIASHFKLPNRFRDGRLLLTKVFSCLSLSLMLTSKKTFKSHGFGYQLFIELVDTMLSSSTFLLYRSSFLLARKSYLFGPVLFCLKQELSSTFTVLGILLQNLAWHNTRFYLQLTLYLLFVDDLTETLSRRSKSFLYVDDLTIKFFFSKSTQGRVKLPWNHKFSFAQSLGSYQLTP